MEDRDLVVPELCTQGALRNTSLRILRLYWITLRASTLKAGLEKSEKPTARFSTRGSGEQEKHRRTGGEGKTKEKRDGGKTKLELTVCAERGIIKDLGS